MISKSYNLNLDLGGTLFQDYKKSNLLFFDIETTGFHARLGYIYLIGTISWENGVWVCRQWFAESHDEEPDVLKEFLSYSKGKTLLVHFNGERFDIPFINEKCQVYHLGTSLSSINSRDLFRMIRPLKSILSFSSLKQRNLEEFVGVKRDDRFSGGELISVYEKYVDHPESDLLSILLLHNKEDLVGLTKILPILSYQTITNETYHVTDYEVNGDNLDIRARLPVILPKPVLYENSLYSLHAEKDHMLVTVKGTRVPLKYFYSDYKNYYYLPKEDMAMHKSVAAFVDKEFREPAKASNCYTRKKGFYLPQNDSLFTPVFKTDYHEKQLYFSCTEKLLENRENITAYIHHLLSDLS